MPESLIGPADRERAQVAVAAAYRAAGLDPPAEMHWCGSPRAAALEYLRRLRVGGTWPPGHGRHQLWSAAERRTVEAGSDSERTAVRRQLLADLLAAAAGEQHPEQLAWAAITGPFERPEAGAFTAVAGPLAEACASAGWWWPDRDFAVIAEPPASAGFDSQDRPHRAGGPVAVFPDGWSVHAWHGLRVPAWVVEHPTVSKISAEVNVEVRRAAIESLGWPTFLETADLTELDSCPDPGNPGTQLTLYRTRWPGPGHAAGLLVCTNGTPELDGTRRTYGLHVPADIRDALSAAAWGYGLARDQYAPTRRT